MNIKNNESLSSDVSLFMIEKNNHFINSAHSNSEKENYLDHTNPQFFFTDRPQKDSFFFTSKTAINTNIALEPKSLKINYRILTQNQDSDLDKEIWQHFLRVYNLLGLIEPQE